jgi:hypothetical protein
MYICRAEIDNYYPIRVLLSLLDGKKFKLSFALRTCGLPSVGKAFSDAQDLVPSVL